METHYTATVPLVLLIFAAVEIWQSFANARGKIGRVVRSFGFFGDVALCSKNCERQVRVDPTACIKELIDVQATSGASRTLLWKVIRAGFSGEREGPLLARCIDHTSGATCDYRFSILPSLPGVGIFVVLAEVEAQTLGVVIFPMGRVG